MQLIIKTFNWLKNLTDDLWPTFTHPLLCLSILRLAKLMVNNGQSNLAKGCKLGVPSPNFPFPWGIRSRLIQCYLGPYEWPCQMACPSITALVGCTLHKCDRRHTYRRTDHITVTCHNKHNRFQQCHLNTDQIQFILSDGIMVGRQIVSTIRYADGKAVFASIQNELQLLMDNLSRVTK